ncbi:LuxR C-terminal-related transcriptional regulator [Specibacter sp. NPDC078709]|uniref:response regulator transcription factor n=1 Tax=Specibacter sp. NPDC078709 TaxID=3154364 RepID=UPI00341891C2
MPARHGRHFYLNDQRRAQSVYRRTLSDAGHNLLSRERVVAQGVAEGMTNGELASSMHMSEATVKLLVSNIMTKVGASKRVQIAVAVAKARVV